MPHRERTEKGPVHEVPLKERIELGLLIGLQAVSLAALVSGVWAYAIRPIVG